MAWLPRVLGRRAAAQRTVLSAVTALTLVACALLGSFALMLTSGQDRAMATALERTRPADVQVAADLRLGTRTRDGDAGAAVAAATEALHRTAQGVPLDLTLWLSTGTLQTTERLSDPVVYLSSLPSPDLAEVVEGELPAPGAPLVDGAIPVAIPRSAAEDLGWDVGDRVHVDGTNSRSAQDVQVVGVYDVAGPRSVWATDLLGAATHDPAYPLPESPLVAVPLWGPLLAPESVLLDNALRVERATVFAAPQLTGLTAPTAADLLDRLADGQAVLRAAADEETRSAAFVTRLDDTLSGIAARLTATRTGILVAALGLTVVAGAALLLAARLLAEQRTAGLALMAARGTSHRQLLTLSVLEAATVALVAAVAAPWLAAPLTTAVAHRIAAPGTTGALTVAEALATPALWATCAVGAVFLAAFLVLPVLRPSDTDVDAPAVRPGRAAAVRAALARSGSTLALLLVAGVAAWQLDRYRTPSGTAGGADPVLVVAPALLLLATALLVVRGLPLLARATDVLAARSRRLVAPLAAWETGRRPDRAAGTVLLLVLAVAGGTFAQTTLTTWRTSQVDQAALAVGTDARLSDVTGTALPASEAVAALPAGFVAVTDRAVTFAGADNDAGSARLLAVDDGSVLRGRVEPGPGVPEDATWSDVVALLGADAPDVPGVPLPEGAVSATLRFTDVISLDHLAESTVRVDLVLEDERGARDLRSVTPVPGTDTAVVALDDDGGLHGARVIGIAMSATPPETVAFETLGTDEAWLTVQLSELTVTDGTGKATAVPLDQVTWTGRTRPISGGVVIDDGPETTGSQKTIQVEQEDGVLTLRQKLDPFIFAFEGDGFMAVPAVEGTFPGVRPGLPELADVPVVITDDLADTADLAPGNRIQLGHPAVVLKVVGEVENLPAGLGQGMLVRRDAWQAAELARLSTPRAPDAWWASVPDADLAALTAAVGDDGVLRTRAGESAALLDGPDRVGLQAALWVLTAAAVLLAGAGVSTSVAAGLRLRRLELARLQALGVSRGTLVRAVLAEHGLLAAVGLAGGAVVGFLVAVLLAPSLAVGPDGGVPAPAPLLDVPWTSLAVLGGAALVVVAISVAVTARSQVRRASADLLRLGADR